MSRRLTLWLLGLAGAAGSCTTAPADLEGWHAATEAIRAGLDQQLADLTRSAQTALAAGGAAAEAPDAALTRMNEIAKARLNAWRALEAYCGRMLPVLREAPYDGRGVRAAAESWRRLVDDVPGVSPETTAQRDETARAMIRANTTASALQAADSAAARLGEDFAAFHQELSDAVLAARDAAAAQLQQDAARLDARRAAVAEIVAAAETELRKEAAGAGVARAGAQATLDANRPELARLEQEAADAARAAAELRFRFTAAAEHVRRTGFAAREWAIAHREAGLALSRGLPEANFRLLQTSAKELGPRPISDTGSDRWK